MSLLVTRASAMTERVRFRCNNCGHRFESEVLDEDRRHEARRENRPTNAVHCPECNRTDIRRGWVGEAVW